MRVILQQPALPKYRVPVFRELARRPGIDLLVLYGQRPGIRNVEADGFEARYVPQWQVPIGSRYLAWHSAQMTATSSARADVAVLYWDLHYASLVPALLRARASGVGTVLWGHGYSKSEAAWRRWPRTHVVALADAALFYSHSVADAFARRTGWREGVFVAPNAIDIAPIEKAISSWRADPTRLERFLADHKLVPARTLLFVSRLEAANRVDLLLRAVPRLLSRFPGLTAVIIGDGPERPRLESLAANLRIQSHVRFLGAVYDEEQVAPWMLSSYGFCYPENIGLSLLHAFGYGLPVITSDGIECQNPEIEALVPGHNGLLYQHGQVDSLVAELERLLAEPLLRDRLGANARDTVRHSYALSRMVDGFEQAIRYADSVP